MAYIQLAGKNYGERNESMSTTTMPEFDAFINIQWTMRVGEASYDLARELVVETVNNLLSDVRYQEISDESIDIELKQL